MDRRRFMKKVKWISLMLIMWVAVSFIHLFTGIKWHFNSSTNQWEKE